jgi:hypothetical protein
MARYYGSVENYAETLIATRANYTSSDGTDVSIYGINSGTLAVAGTNTTWNTDGDDGFATRGSALILTEDSIDAEGTILRVASVASDTSLTLDKYPFATFTGKEYSFKMHHDRYDLPDDFLDFVSASIEGAATRELQYLSPSEIDAMRHTVRGLPYSEGIPRYVTIRQVSNALYQMELDPFPDDVYGVSLTYKKAHATELSSDSDIIPLADEDIDVLVRGVVAYWQQANKYQEMGSAYERWLKTDLERWIVFNKKTTDEMVRFRPDNTMRAGGQRGMLRFSSEFDRR